MPFDTDILASGAGHPDAYPPSLADIAHRSLIEWFASDGHRPSPAQWEAILDLLDHLESATNQSVEKAVYVSAIPAGTGKSASLASFAAALCDSPGCGGAGMLILCNRVTEVHDMAEALQPHRGKLCVIVGRDNTAELAMGDHAEADQAQIVISTQAALKETLRAVRHFDDAGRYFYRGARRAVIAWDESLAFNRPVMLDGDTIGGLAKAMGRQTPEARIALLEWQLALARSPTGECTIPDFGALGVDFRRLEADAGDHDDLVAQAKALGIISGGTGWVIRDNTQASTMVTYVPEIPGSLMPVVVTDASAARGVHHASYAQMETHRPVIYLKEAAKTYRNLTLRIVPTAASRSVYRDRTSPRGRDLIDMGVRYIRSVAPAEVLVVSYRTYMVMRGVEQRTIEAAINARLTEDECRRVRHVTYGRHTATNDHKHVRHVLLMGLNFVPRAATYATSGAALNKPMRTANPSDHPTEDQVDEMRTGMLRDTTMQALLRGHARMGMDGDCGEMEAVIAQTKQTGLTEADYRGMFPGATIREDHTLLPAKPLRGRLKALSEIVAARLAAGEREMTNPSLYDALGMSRQNFAKIVKGPEWQDWVTAMGLHPQPLKGGVMGLRME